MWDKIVLFVTICLVTFFVRKIISAKPNKIQFYSYFAFFYVTSSLLACVIWPYFLLSPKNVRNAKVSANILKHVTKVLDIKWELRNGEILTEDRGAVIVSNHQSAFDILGLFNVWEVVGKMTAIAKKEIFYVWPFGLAAYLAGVVFIDRSNAKKSYEQLMVTSDVMVNQKVKIWLFPEGTRNKDYTKMLPFKKGAFTMAISTQVPIIPVVFSPYYFINRKKYLFQKGHIVMQCLQPVATKGMTLDDLPKLMEEVRSSMEATYDQLAIEVLGNLPKKYQHTSVG
ncbi:1-acyl-sn-glycerol-3-phosphate acyltransferase alpha-like [Cydia splendana]|uniref:1-acyl-sn-glycerol-3-phosphate acyltransferase alpha-like n=1 Tax=Cydia splendana TaxID=1100963 RepID=UPI0021214C12